MTAFVKTAIDRIGFILGVAAMTGPAVVLASALIH